MLETRLLDDVTELDTWFFRVCVIGGANAPQRRSRPERQFPSPADPPRGCWSGERTCVFPAPSPWVGVVVPDGDLGRLKEVIGVGARVPVGTLKCLEAL
jgi:hypothetical protein